MPSDALIHSLLAAVAAAPDDVPLRLHLAGLLVDAGRAAEALPHVSQALSTSPGDAAALALLQRATAHLAGTAPASPAPPSSEPPATPAPGATLGATPGDRAAFDWSAAEEQVADVEHPFTQPAFVDPAVAPGDHEGFADIESPTVRLSDVGGMVEVKRRLDIAFLTPMRNPELRRAYSKSLRGGLLMYGPPGCGKTHIARALAGELEARFTSISLSDVLDMFVGASERNVHGVFEAARRAAPCVLFLDEIDALGLKRSRMQGSSRMTVNQLLVELDGIGSSNDGVFVLAATNAPWDVDPALRRPGRLDRMMLVLPPDPPAREAILRHSLSGRPVVGVDLGRIVAATEDFSGADLDHLVDTATEYSLDASARSGTVQPITMRELEAALREVRPTTGTWFGTARNVAEFGNTHGEYDELLAYLKRRRGR